jgi:hypothetical protein
VLYVVMAWTIAFGGIFMAVVCALNFLGLARGWLRTGADPLGGLGLGMVSAGLAGSVWAMPINDEPFETWRQYWMLLGGLGLVLMIGSEVRRSGEAGVLWRWVRHGARFHTSRSEWRRKHFLVLGAVTALFFLPAFAPRDGWLFWVAFIPFLVLSDTLKILPIHFGRRPPAADPATKS